MSTLHPSLRENVRMLGNMLGENMKEHLGEDFLQQIESIRAAAKEDRGKEGDASERLHTILSEIDDDNLVNVVRAFNQFLNLANIAEQYHSVRRHRSDEEQGLERMDHLFARLLSTGLSKEQLASCVEDLSIEFVLTAHPTEVTRRTMIMKYEAIAESLDVLDHDDLSDKERRDRQALIKRLVCEGWHTNEIREERPTAVDEARWGFAVIENSLWAALPQFLNDLNIALEDAGCEPLPLNASPIRMASWMGGDRDGNPNVTAALTREVLCLSRWMAADLYLRDIRQLLDQLSMWDASDELLELAEGLTQDVSRNTDEPYRKVLSQLRERLMITRDWAAAKAKHENYHSDQILIDTQELLRPLEVCYRSLVEKGMQTVANGLLLDTIRRLNCFGLELIKLDLRQDSQRHTDALSDITRYLGLGDYGDWSEERKCEFLLAELKSKRPLVPRDWPASDETTEVMDTMRVLAEFPQASFGSYVISMASHPSDVLAVALLLQDAGVRYPIQIVPLFETLSDLSGASQAVHSLLSIPWYRSYCAGRIQVMIGYSDSAKDAGQMSAAWAQYQAQEKLVDVAEQHDVKLTLFHGRGGTVGRGGGPANRAILSQPPGSVNGSFRITEQGEMIRFKFGMPAIARESLRLYANAVIEATLLPPPLPKAEWRELMHAMTDKSVKSYRAVVREHPDFVAYFRSVTPEQELAKLALGSRPARRKATGGVESLRAIPWIFAWTQIRLMLPAWLGSDEALAYALDERPDTLREMVKDWPFFNTHIDMLEMVLAKGDQRIARYYDQVLVDEDLKSLGDTLRKRFDDIIGLASKVKGQTHLLADSPLIENALALRNPYIDPLHYIQAELLRRERDPSESEASKRLIEAALKVSMTGIAAGLRNTG